MQQQISFKSVYSKTSCFGSLSMMSSMSSSNSNSQPSVLVVSKKVNGKNYKVVELVLCNFINCFVAMRKLSRDFNII